MKDNQKSEIRIRSNDISRILGVFYFSIVALNVLAVPLSSKSINTQNINMMDSIIERLKQNSKEIEILQQKMFQLRPITTHQTIKQQDIQNDNTNTLADSNFKDSLKKLYNKLPPFNFNNLKKSDQQISVHRQCRIEINQETQNNRKNNYHFLSSQNQYFILISDFTLGNVKIYDFKCNLLAKINNLTVKFLFQQEKSPTRSGFSSQKDYAEKQSIFAISGKNQLIQINLSSIKENYQQLKSRKLSMKGLSALLQNDDKKVFYRILNNKLITEIHSQKGQKTQQIIGVLMKTLYNTQIRSKEQRSAVSSYQKSLIVAFDSSEIRIFDEAGVLKLTMKQQLAVDELFKELNGNQGFIEAQNDQNFKKGQMQLINYHPYPILLQNDWIYFIDTNKYTRQAWVCPYIPNVKKLFVENIHSDEVFILTEQTILKMKVKAKDSQNPKKGHCQLQKSIPYFNPFIKNKKPSQITFSVHKNLIFLDNLVYNMTSNQYLSINPSRIADEEQTLQDVRKIDCDHISLQYIPNTQKTTHKKSQNQKHYTMSLICESENMEYLQLYSITQTKQQSSALIYIIFAFVAVIFLAVKFFKSTSSNFEKQLLYSQTLTAQERQIRKQQYQQLQKYLEQARREDKQQKLSNLPKERVKKNTINQKQKKQKKQ